MPEERAPYGARRAKVDGKLGSCCGARVNLLPLACKYRTVLELGAVGVTEAVCVCGACGQIVLATGIAPDGSLARGRLAPAGSLLFTVERAAPFVGLAERVLNGGVSPSPDDEEDPFRE